MVNPGLRQWAEQDTVYLVSFFTTKSVLADYILYEESLYYTTSKTSGKVILNSGEGFLTSAFPKEEQSIEPPSSEEEDTLGVLPSALGPRLTESTDNTFLMDLVKEAETKAVPPAATHTQQPSLPGFET